jgi:hypothetical protein
MPNTVGGPRQHVPYTVPKEKHLPRGAQRTRPLIIFVLVAGASSIAILGSSKKLASFSLDIVQASGPASQENKSEANMNASPSPVITDEIKIIDSQGHPRIVMSAKSGNPVIRLLQTNGAPGVEVLLDSTGHPAVKLANPDPKGPTAALAVDDKGTHVKFDRPGGASSYLFLNNAGESGVVFVDAKGVRRLNILVGPENDAKIERFGSDGKPMPQLQP